ncbi:ecto-NOX disulfide-thiol exchanger 2 isoform X2 [Syngnathus scovelli]|uniref:ecto-NOX disulfide-thiol exchanger 2 isoform X2 n=1 Tax=Syngnathus scovelli TaxID=161590 RepID=UPI002110720C|nr:ecto-NOX disulfide-thiol exchanger 2 isoform X2 [Syngnathus scovelli]
MMMRRRRRRMMMTHGPPVRVCASPRADVRATAQRLKLLLARFIFIVVAFLPERLHVRRLSASAMTSRGSAANGVAPPPVTGKASLLPQRPLAAANFLCPEASSSGSAHPPPVKEIIRLKGCTLVPPNPRLPPPSTRSRPPGCKTVFVGGLPERAGDDIVREVFSSCGDIVALRKSKKNFCHIRFGEEFMVDRALRLSGYRLHLGSADKKDSGRIHVDFAQARDDLYEWECKQRLLQGEKGQGQQEPPSLPPPPPPPLSLMPYFSEQEAALLAECLKDKHRFSWAASVLLWWLDGGQVNRASANHMYALLQSANAHAGRLRRDAAQQRQVLRKARAAFRCALATILQQLDQVSSVLAASGRQKSRDHFSKAQRKNIELWTRQCQVGTRRSPALWRITVGGLIAGVTVDAGVTDPDPLHDPSLVHAKVRGRDDGDEGDDVADDEGADERSLVMMKLLKATLMCSQADSEQLSGLRRHRDDEDEDEPGLFRKKMKTAKMSTCGHRDDEAFEEEGEELLSQEAEPPRGEASVPPLLPAQQVLSLRDDPAGEEAELQRARTQAHFLEGEPLLLQQSVMCGAELREKVSAALGPLGSCAHQVTSVLAPAPAFWSSSAWHASGETGGVLVSEKEALLLGVVSAFLHVHPFGANLEYLCSYVRTLDCQVSSGQLERLMVRLPLMFRQELSGVGATLEKRWKFCGFDSLRSG